MFALFELSSTTTGKLAEPYRLRPAKTEELGVAAIANASLELGWRLLAQLALRDTNALMALVSQAESRTIPRIGWIGIATTLQGEALKEGLLTTVSAENLLRRPHELLSQRVDLIQLLLAVTQNDLARKILTNAMTQLNVHTLSQPARYSSPFSGDSYLAQIPLPADSTNGPLSQRIDPSWALIAQVVLRDDDDDALTVLLRQADPNRISRAGWTGITATLQSQSLKEGILEPVSAEDLFRKPEELRNERLQLITLLLALPPNTEAHQLLIMAQSRLKAESL